MGGRGERLEFERGGRYIYQWLWAEPVPTVSRVVPVLALRAGVVMLLYVLRDMSQGQGCVR